MGHSKKLTIAIGIIKNVHNKEINKTNKKVVNLLERWNKNEKKSGKYQEKITK